MRTLSSLILLVTGMAWGQAAPATCAWWKGVDGRQRCTFPEDRIFVEPVGGGVIWGDKAIESFSGLQDYDGPAMSHIEPNHIIAGRAQIDNPKWPPVEDVPAISSRQETVWAANCSSDHMCYDVPELIDIWTCAEKGRILQHDENTPPKFWCHAPNTQGGK